ncbi:MAG: hypothetical protein ABIP13_08815 [Tepidiformaceae bacterium]
MSGELPEELGEPGEKHGNPVLGWARAVVFGVRDTATHMLDEGRRGAREAQEDGWQRFDDKTKNRRKHR